MLIMYTITDDSSQAVDQLSVEELSDALEEKGYRTISQDDFISYSVYLDEQKKAAQEEGNESKEVKDSKKKKKEKSDDDDKSQSKSKDKKDKDDQKKKKKDKKDKKDKKKSATIKVEQGYVSQDIGEALKNENIIDDVDKFVKYMEDNGYSENIQIGSFKVNSDMSLKKLAETLTTYPGD